MNIEYKVLIKIQKFYSDEIYYRVQHCKTWEDVCRTVDPLYIITGIEPTPIKYYTDPAYGETWVFASHETGWSSSPDTMSYIAFVDNAGTW